MIQIGYLVASVFELIIKIIHVKNEFIARLQLAFTNTELFDKHISFAIWPNHH